MPRPESTTSPSRASRPLMNARDGLPWNTPLILAFATKERKAGLASAPALPPASTAVVAEKPGLTDVETEAFGAAGDFALGVEPEPAAGFVAVLFATSSPLAT